MSRTRPWKPSEAQIRARWGWNKGYARATRQNIRLAVRRTRNSFGITGSGRPYVQPVAGMRVLTYANEPGVIAAVRKPLFRNGDPEVLIQLDNGRRAFLFQTAINGYTFQINHTPTTTIP